MERGNYDYIFNLSAMKHVRSENSAFSMYRMFETNVLNVIKTYNWAATSGASKYFCVSSTKQQIQQTTGCYKTCDGTLLDAGRSENSNHWSAFRQCSFF